MDSRKFSVITMSNLESSQICGQYHGMLTIDSRCSDDNTTSHTIHVQMVGGTLKLASVRSVLTNKSDDRVRFELTSRHDSQWTAHIRSARDLFEQNMEVIHEDGSERFYVRTTRAVVQGEELFVWYSNELGRKMSLPILSPVHIKGYQMYQCDGCPKRFKNPNPLKAHLRTHAWDSPKTPSTPGSNSFGFGDKPLNLTPFRPYDPAFTSHNTRQIKSTGSSPDFVKPASYSTSPINNMDSTPMPSYNPFLYHPVTLAVLPHIGYPSPFPNNLPYGGLYPMLPYPPPLLSNNGPRVVPSYPIPSQNLVNMSMIGATGGKIEPGNIFLESPRMQGSDESNMLPKLIYRNGSDSKNGYLCIYCGKLYSRKYGLKIHVRTHTGFKPLKCKVCHRPFGDPSNLNKHIRLHAEGDTPYRCPHCGKVLVRRRDLERHIRSRHSNESGSSPLDENQLAVTSSDYLSDDQINVDDDDDEDDDDDIDV